MAVSRGVPIGLPANATAAPSSAVPIPQVAVDSGRMLSLDVLRLLAVVGVVWFHLGAVGREYLSWHVPVIVAILSYLASGGGRVHGSSHGSGRPMREVLRRRWRRLLLPWFIWSAIYVPILVARIRLGAGQAAWEPWMLLTGPSLHLWFLPFALAATLAAILLRRIGENRRYLLAYAYLLIGCAGSFAVAMGLPHLPIPLAQWSAAVPSIFFGTAIALLVAAAKSDPDFVSASGWRRPFLTLTTVLFFLACAATLVARWDLHLLSVHGILLPASLGDAAALPWTLLIAAPLLAGAVCVPVETPQWLCRVFDTSLGIYLIHPLFASLLNFGTGGRLGPEWMAVSCIAASFVAVLVLLGTRARWLV